MIKGELEEIIGKLIKAYSKYMQEELAKIEITTGQPKILAYLFKHDGCIQRDLASYCELSPATVTNSLLGMEKAGFVFRLNDSSDRRILRVFITEKGLQALEKIDKVVQEFEKISLKDFSPEEKESIRNNVEHLVYNLRNQSSA